MVDEKDNDILNDDQPESLPDENVRVGASNRDFSPIESGEDDLPDEVPAVSVAKKKNAIIVIVLVAVAFFIAYNIFLTPDKQKKKSRVKNETAADEAGKSEEI